MSYTAKRPDVIQRSRRQSRPRRAPLPESEQVQLERMACSMGPIAAARALGVKVDTLHSARSGAPVNPSTRSTMLASGWLLPERNPAP